MASRTSSSSLPSVEEREQKFSQLDPQQAQARLQTFPSQMAYEAKYALQQVKEIATEQGADPGQVVEIVEPLAKAVGWAEALSFAFDKLTEKDAVQHLIANGQQQITKSR